MVLPWKETRLLFILMLSNQGRKLVFISVVGQEDCGNNTIYDVTHTTGPENDDELNTVGFWPWMASIGFYNEDQKWIHRCGATLITHEHFLTAAHCASANERLASFVPHIF